MCAPSNLCFTFVLIGFLAFEGLKQSGSWEKFLSLRKQQNLFVNAVYEMCLNDERCGFVQKFSCQNSHSIFLCVIHKLFNCFAKNVAKNMNEDRAICQKHSYDRKLRKMK